MPRPRKTKKKTSTKDKTLQIPESGSSTPEHSGADFYQPTKKETKLLTYISEREHAMEMAVSDYLEEWEEYNDLFENMVTEDDDGIVNVNFPTEFSVIETRMAKEYQSLPASRIIPVEEGDHYKAQLYDELLYNAEAAGNWDWERFKLILGKHILGTSIQKNTIRREVRTKKIPIGTDKKTGKLRYKEMDVLKFDDIYKKYVDLRFFRIDDKATSMDDARDCIEYMPMSMDEFLQTYSGGRYKNVDKVKAYGSGSDATNIRGNLSKEEEKRLYALFEDEVIVAEYYNEVKDLMVTRANGVIIEEQPMPYIHKELPYARRIATALMNSFYGRGAPRLLKAIKAIKNILWNTALRKALIANKPVIVMPKRAGWKSENFKFEEGAVWRVPFDPNTIRVLESTGLKQDLIMLLRNVEDEIPLAYGVDPRVILPASKETATKTATREEVSNDRIELGVKLTEMNTMVRSTKMDISNIKQLYSEKRILRITSKGAKGEVIDETVPQFRKARFYGKDFDIKKLKNSNKYYIDGITPLKGEFGWLEIRPEFLQGDFDVQVVTTQLPFSKAFKQEMMQKFYETMQGHPNIDQAKLATEYIKENEGNPDELVIDPQQQQNKEIPQLGASGRPPEETGAMAGNPAATPMPPMPM